jgi:hypothetical protein
MPTGRESPTTQLGILPLDRQKASMLLCKVMDGLFGITAIGVVKNYYW